MGVEPDGGLYELFPVGESVGIGNEPVGDW
jgi:hypothetical protein